MKKGLLSLVAIFALGALGGCDYLNSPEKKAFDQFLAHCKATPASADCKAYADSKKEGAGGPN